MTTQEVEFEASRFGFHLEQVEDDVQGSVLMWHRGTDYRWPSFLTEREALDWMENRLNGINFTPG